MFNAVVYDPGDFRIGARAQVNDVAKVLAKVVEAFGFNSANKSTRGVSVCRQIAHDLVSRQNIVKSGILKTLGIGQISAKSKSDRGLAIAK